MKLVKTICELSQEKQIYLADKMDGEEIAEDAALAYLYEEVDPMHKHTINEYRLIGPNSYGRIGIDYK